MADRMLFIGWDEPVRGREELALEAFNDSVGFYGRCQQEGRIESFDVCFLAPNGSGLGGYFQLHGTADQCHAISDDTEFVKLMTAAALCVDGLRVVDGYTGQGVADQMTIWTEAIAKAPQMA